MGAAGFARGMGEVSAECLVPGEPSGKPLDEVEAGTRGGVAGEVQASGGSGSVAVGWRGWPTVPFPERLQHIG